MWSLRVRPPSKLIVPMGGSSNQVATAVGALLELEEKAAAVG